MQKTIRLVGKVRSKPVVTIPGDTLRVLTAAATDDRGETWPAGTEFRSQSGGADNQLGGESRVVLVANSPKKYLVELSDVTPNRATVDSVEPVGDDNRVSPRSLRYAVVSADNLPDVGERVWVRGDGRSRGAIEITGRQR